MIIYQRLPEFSELEASYNSLPKQPLAITCALDSPLLSYAPVHFDSLLSYAVYEQATQGQGIAHDPRRPIFIPLPLAQVWEWQSIPLWASTDLLANDGLQQSPLYIHRRSLEPHQTLANLVTSKGRYKDKRVALPMVANATLRAEVIGNAEVIAELLQKVTSIGKKRNAHGAVGSWIIEPIARFTLLDAERKTKRVIPFHYFVEEEGFTPAALPQQIAFAPPYWHPLLVAACLPTGTTV